MADKAHNTLATDPGRGTGSIAEAEAKPHADEIEFTDKPHHSIANSDEDPPDFVIDLPLMANVFALCLTVAAGSWSTQVPASSIAFIVQKFPASAGNAAWIAASSSVTAAVVSSFIGDMSDIFGRRIFLFIGCACGFVGMLVAGTADNITTVIGGQVLIGIATATNLLASPLLQEIVPKKYRASAVACATLLSSFSFIGGPVIQGLCIQQGVGGELDGWRVGFYIGAAIWAVTGVCLLAFYHPMPRPNPEGISVARRIQKLDWLGIFLVSAGVTLFLVGLQYGDNPYPWTSPIVLGTLIPGATLCLLFCLWEWKGTATGIIPHALFHDKNYAVTICVRVIGGMGLLGGQAYLPQVAVNVFGTDGLETSVWQLPLSVSSVAGAFVGALLLKFFREARWMIPGLILVMVLGAGLMLLIKPGVSFAAWFFASILMGLPIGVEAVLLSVLAGFFVPNELIATGICVTNAATLVGGAVAVIIYGTVFNSKIKTALPDRVTTSVLQAGLPQSSLVQFLSAYLAGNLQTLSGLTDVPGVTPRVLDAAKDASRGAYADSYHYIWYILIALSGACTLLALRFGSTKHYFTDEVTAPIQRRKGESHAEAEKV
ncbi:major facilitator superfamily domain-containing protein [Aspergillus germanicus]